MPLTSKQRKNTSNPLELTIGQKVKIKYVSKVNYIGEQKQVVKRPMERETYIIGIVKKAIGTYINGTGYSSIEDYEQARLAVSSYIWLYQTRETMSSPILLVSTEDIEV